jgi:hypothetical protein
MMERFSILVLTVILALPALSNAQSTSEDQIRSHYVALLQDYASRRAVRENAESGLTDSDMNRATAVASGAVIDCFMAKLEVIALTNNIDKHTFMDALAFAIAWKSESEFFDNLKGVEHLGKQAKQCVDGEFKTRGIRLK